MAINISITAGSGYFGSTYTHDAVVAGNWYANEVAISGATGTTYTMESKYEGQKITFRTTSPAETSNVIRMHTPDQISGLLADWDASRDDLMTNVSGATSLVTPRAGSQPTLTLSQSTAGARPAYSATARNGKPGWTGDGVDDIFIVDNSGLLPSGTTPSAVIAAAYCGASTGSNWRGLFTYASAATSRSPARDNLGNAAWGGFNTTWDTKSLVPWISVDLIYSAQFDTTIRLWPNGDLTGVSNANSNPSTPNTNNARVMGSSTAADKWPGVLQEMMLYNVALTTAQRQLNEGYIAHKWGLTSLLPGGHPYKSTAPLSQISFNGSISFGNMTATGVGVVPWPFTGAPSFGSMTATGVMTQKTSATGAISFADMTLTGVMNQKLVFSGAPAFDPMTVTGVMDQKLNASGSISFAAMTATGFLGFGGAFDGYAAFGSMTATGALTYTPHYDVAGAIAFSDMTLTGTLVYANAAFFNGQMQFDTMTATGTIIFDFEGVVSFGNMTMDGLIVLGVQADGAMAFGEMTVTGSMGFTDPMVTPILFGEMTVAGVMSFIEPDVIVEDGSVVPGANSYITISYADYYLGKQGHTDWVAAPLEDRISALIRATLGIDSTYGARYPGVKVSGRSQSLMWPRKDAEDNDGEDIPLDEVPIEIRKATAEAAYLEWITPGYLSPNWSVDQLVTQETLGPLSVSYSDPAAFGRGGNLPTLTKIDGILYPILGSSAPGFFGTTTRI